MKMVYKKILLLLVLLVCSSTVHAATYYVATDGNDGNAGTEAFPWLTIQKAADIMVAGDTVLVKGGTYTVQGTCGTPTTSVCGIKPQNSGSPGNPITYQENPGDTVIIDQQNAVSPRVYYGFYLEDKDYITIKGFEIKNVKAQAGIKIISYSDNVTVDGVYIHHIDGPGGANTAAVRIDYSRYTTVQNSVLHDITVAGVDNQNSATILAIDMPDAVIENNLMYNAYSGVFHKRSSGSKGAIIRDNIIHDTTQYGVRYSVAGIGDPPHIDAEVYRNIFYNLPMAIYASTYETVTDSTGLDIYNNVFNTNTGVYIYGFKDVKMWNNIFYNTSSESIHTQGAPALNSITLSNYNLFYANPVFVLNNGDASEQNYYSRAAWLGGTGYDVNGLDSDPMFVNVSDRNYKLLADSPAKNGGNSDGTGSGTVVEMGAYPLGTGLVGPGNIPLAPTNIFVD